MSRFMTGSRVVLSMVALKRGHRVGMQPRRWLEMAAGSSKNDQFSISGEAAEGRSSFLDNQSTTPLDPRVLDAMLPLMTWEYGNPHSRSHHYGWEAENAVEEARGHIAKLIGADPKEIIWTSGATECNNMAVKGVTRFYKGKKKHVITVQTEHKCVLDSCRVLQQEGFEVRRLR
jgi:cysteine desulfurase